MTPQTNRKAVACLAVAALVLPIVLSVVLSERSATAEPPPPPPPLMAVPAPEKAPSPDAVVVEVNGEKLTEAMLVEQVQQQAQAMTGGRPIPPQQLQMFMPMLRQKVEERFVMTTLLKGESERLKIAVSDKDVNDAVADIEKRIPPGMTLDAALQQQGLTQAELRDKITEDMRIRKLLDQEIPADVEISGEEIAAFFEANKGQMASPESVHARHILIKTDGDADDATKAAAKKKAESLHKELVDGADFAETAKENSDCPSAQKGGDLGTFTRGRMVPEFEEAAFSQKENDVGPVVETKFGYHIVQVLEHKEAAAVTLEDKKAEITDKITKQKQGENFGKYIEGLKANAKITRPVDAPAEE